MLARGVCSGLLIRTTERTDSPRLTSARLVAPPPAAGGRTGDEAASSRDRSCGPWSVQSETRNGAQNLSQISARDVHDAMQGPFCYAV